MPKRARFPLDARERLEARLFHAEPAIHLLGLGPRGAQGVQPVGEPHLLHPEADEAQHEGHEDAGRRRPRQHGAQAPAIALPMEARDLLVGGGRGPEPE